ncbi:hypothetical protein BVC80_1805g53 [Macleaya cordata]|uniref:Uncharacterized protein n=1 Tax=Macleaya cordata TaxID=56857 RepID=A0A200QQW3_MACCD|nr:hypothetical protein BVC80_1805g53 [Macleaya cordata]
MALPPGPYSGTSTLALVARASAFTFGIVYGNLKLKYLTVLLFISMKPNVADSFVITSPVQVGSKFVNFEPLESCITILGIELIDTLFFVNRLSGSFV